MELLGRRSITGDFPDEIQGVAQERRAFKPQPQRQNSWTRSQDSHLQLGMLWRWEPDHLHGNPRRTSPELPAQVGSTRPPHEQSVNTETVFTTMTESERAMVRSQGGPGAGAPFTVCPTGVKTRIDPHLFRTLLLRRLRLPLSMSKRICRCGHPLDSRGHHRAACARAGVLGEDLQRRALPPGCVGREEPG